MVWNRSGTRKRRSWQGLCRLILFCGVRLQQTRFELFSRRNSPDIFVVEKNLLYVFVKLLKLVVIVK